MKVGFGEKGRPAVEDDVDGASGDLDAKARG